MKQILIGLAVLACSALGGCASFNHDAAPRWEVDTARMKAVESAAQRNGVGVVWVSPPMRKVPAGS